MTYKIKRGDKESTFDDFDKFRENVEFLEREGVDFETETPGDDDGDKADPGTPAAKAAEPDTPTLRVLTCGRRASVYDDIDEVCERRASV